MSPRQSRSYDRDCFISERDSILFANSICLPWDCEKPHYSCILLSVICFLRIRGGFQNENQA